MANTPDKIEGVVTAELGIKMPGGKWRGVGFIDMPYSLHVEYVKPPTVVASRVELGDDEDGDDFDAAGMCRKRGCAVVHGKDDPHSPAS